MIQPEPLTFLALDTCTESCSVALLARGQSYQAQIDAPREHSQRLLPMVDKLLSQAEVNKQDIEFIAYGRGPGSFTGIRICTSMTQGLALGLNIPVIGVSTLQAMAQRAIEAQGIDQIFCAIDARMGEIYWGQFHACDGIATLLDQERVSKPEDVTLLLNTDESVVCAGTGFDAFPELLNLGTHMQLCEQAKFPQARDMLTLAKIAWKKGKATNVDDLAPVYLRDTVTWKKLPGRE